MNEAQALFKLQTLDLEIEDLARSLEEIEGQLGESDNLKAARAKVLELEGQRHALETSLREAEWDVEDLTNRIKPLDTKLYGGTVRNPKELDALQKDVEHLKRNRDAAEIKAIELMEQIDDLQRSLRQARAELDSVQTDWERQQQELQQNKSTITARTGELNASRQALAATVSSASLQIYDDLRRTRRGRAVARVEQNTCQGCRVAIPMLEVQRARNNPELSFCGHCGRILLVSR